MDIMDIRREQCGIYDANVNNYPRLRGETCDSVRIMRADEECSGRSYPELKEYPF